MKYSKEFKLECVMKYKNGEHIKDPPGTKHRHFYKQVLKWVQQYDSLGELALEHNRPTLSIEDRIKLFIKVENGESYTSVARSAGTHESQLIKWHKIYLQDGIEGLQSLKRGKPKVSKKPKVVKPLEQMSPEEKIKYYEERLEYLEAENAYLKKLKALVEGRQDRQQTKE